MTKENKILCAATLLLTTHHEHKLTATKPSLVENLAFTTIGTVFIVANLAFTITETTEINSRT